MEPFFKRWFEAPGLHDDIFGEQFAAREVILDGQNKDLFLKMMKDYVKVHQEKGQKFHPQFESDVSAVHRYAGSRYLFAGAGALFALTVFNPNFTRRRSWYFRKFSVFAFGVVGWNWGNKLYKD